MKLDTLVFGAYLLAVVLVGVLASRRKRASDDYFLASRNLTWWIIGGSLVAANISTHHFIGMAGQGYAIGLAVASYEWIAAVALIIYGKFFLPHYLKTRITTMPEFLENRFNHQVRLVFAVISLTGYLKLLVPVLVVLPGIIAFELYDPAVGLLREQHTLAKGDLAFPTLVKLLLPDGLTGLVMAGLVGCLLIWWQRSPADSVPARAIVDRSFAPADLAFMQRLPWWRSFGFWSVLLLAILVALYVRFF